MRCIQLALLLLVCVVASVCVAFPCVQTAIVKNTGSFSDLVKKVAAYDYEKRKLEDDYASDHNLEPAELKKITAATGIISCNGGKIKGTANLTVGSNVITTANHMFFNLDDCKQVSKPNSCQFIVSGPRGTEKYPVDSLADAGFHCPGTKPDRAADWAVLKLKRPVPGVAPYEISANIKDDLRDGQKVVAVAGISADFSRVDSKTGSRMLPRNIQDCSVGHVYHPPDSDVASTNCGGSFGSTGQAILDSDLKHPKLLAMSIADFKSKEDAAYERRTGKPVIRPFKEGEWANYSVPIAGKFLNAILSAVE